MTSERCTAFPFLSFLFLTSTWQPSNLKPGSFLCLHSCSSGSLSHLSSFSGTQSCVRSGSPFVDVCYHLYELPLMRLSGVQTLAWGWRRQGLEWGKCPHPSSQYRALSGAQPLSAAGKHPGIADGGRERERQAWSDLFSALCLSACVFLKLIKSPPPVFFCCCLMAVIADNGLLCWSADCWDPVHQCWETQILILTIQTTKQTTIKSIFIVFSCVSHPYRFSPLLNLRLLFLGGVPEAVRSEVRCQEVKAQLITRGREFKKTFVSCGKHVLSTVRLYMLR